MPSLNLTLGQSSDDAREYDNFDNPGFTYILTTNNPSGIAISFGDGNGQNIYRGGFRFPNVTIPKNSIITSARLGLELSNIWQDFGNYQYALNVRGHLVPNAATFSSGDGPASRSPVTVAYLGVFGNPSKSTEIVTLDIKSIIQEIVNQAGWEVGNGLSLVVSDGGNKGDPRPCTLGSFDSVGKNAGLDIVYVEPSTGLDNWWKHKLTESA